MLSDGRCWLNPPSRIRGRSATSALLIGTVTIMAMLAGVLSALGALGIIAVLAGLVLIWQGWRGYRIGTAPTCRRCNYDLSGRIGADRGGPVESATCPECGVDLRRGRAIAAGGVRRSGRRALAGLVVALAGLAIASATIGPRLVGVNPLEYVPTGVLLVGERISNDAWRFEIAERIADGKVAAHSVTTLVDRMLDRIDAVHEEDLRAGAPAGSTLRSGTRLGELRILEHAFTTDAMTDDQIGRLVEVLLAGGLTVAIEPFVPVAFSVTGSAELPDAVPLPIESGAVAMLALAKAAPATSGRPLRSGGPGLRIAVQIDELVGPSLVKPVRIAWTPGISVFGSSRTGRSWNVALPAGRHEVHAIGSVSVRRIEELPPGGREFGRSRHVDPIDPSEPNNQPIDEPIRSWPISLPVVVEVAEATPSIITPTTDPALRDAVRAAIRIERGPEAVARHLGRAPQRGFDDVLVVSVDPSAPVEVCMQVYARSGGREHLIGMLCPMSRGGMPLIVTGMEMRFAASGGEQTIDLVLKPAGELLRDRRGTISYWNEEIVITGIPISVANDEQE